MRLFFAIELPEDVRARLAQLRPQDSAQAGDYRWADAAQMHVTLAFLGQQPPEQLLTLERVGAAAARESQAARLKLAEAGCFGPRRAPRVLWIGLGGDVAAVQKLQGRLDAGLRGAGFQLEDRPFRPHITLARRRETARSGPPAKWPPPNKISAPTRSMYGI